MKKSGLVLALFVALPAVIGFAETSRAVIPHGASPVLARTIEYDRILTTPPSVSLEQRHLLAVILAAAETQTTDPSEILGAYRQAGMLVTYLVSSDTGYVWSGTQWDNDTRSTYSYTSGKLTDLTTQQWDFDSSKWINASKMATTYDGGGRPSVTTSQTWTTDHWEDQSRSTFTYDGSGNMTVLVSEIAQGGVLVNFYKTTLTYSGGRVDSSYAYIWSTSPDPDDWVVQGRAGYAYNVNGVLTMLTNEGWNDPTWVNTVRITYTLDVNDRTIQTLTQSYAGDWNNLYKTDYTLDGAGNEILSVRSTWLGSWSATDTDTSRYSSNKLIEQVHLNIQFTQLTRDLYTYDGLGNQITDEYQQWTGSEWVNVTRTVYVYIIAGVFDDDAAGQVPSEFDLAQNYPNPFNLSTIIPYSLAGDSRVKITVSNILDQTVTTLVDAVQSAGSHTSLWNGQDTNGRDVASGVYFFRVQVGEHSEVRKMVLLK